jgi:branched-chain amino acid transport system substrate-binding protein
MMKRTLIFSLSVVVFLMMSAGLVLAGGEKERVAEEEFVIGMAHSHTGWAAAFDVAFTCGVKYAADEINSNGGIAGKYQIKLITGRDCASIAAEAVKSVDALLAKDVDMIALTCDSSGAIAAGRHGQEQGILMITSTGSQPMTPIRVGDWMYASNFTDNLMGSALAIYAREELKIDTAFTLISYDDAYTELPKYFAEIFEKKGGKIVGEATYNFEQVDFGSVVSQIKQLPEEPDAIMTAAFEPDFPAFLRQIRAAGIKSRVIGADALDTPTVYSLGPVAEGVTLCTNRVPVPGSEYEKIMKGYAEKYPEHVENAASIVGYIAMYLMAAAVEKADSTEPEKVRAALDSLENWQGPTGPITFKGMKNRLPIMPVHILEVVDGKGVYRKMVIPNKKDIAEPY